MTIADEWWRTISANSGCTDLERCSPCYYVHDHDLSKGDYKGCAMISGGYLPKEFSKYARVKWPPSVRTYGGGYLPASPPTIPLQDATDHVSGNTFFIRSRAEPCDFWYVLPEVGYMGELRVSRKNRTRFRITAKDAPAPLNGGPIVMIGSDAIEIAETRSGNVVGISSYGYLVLGAPVSAMEQPVVEERAIEEPLVVEERGEDPVTTAEVTTEGNREDNAQIFFKDLRTRFAVAPGDSIRRLEVGNGELWELV